MSRPRKPPESCPAPLSGAVAAVIDAAGVLVQWTEGAAGLLGLPDSEVVGRPARGLLARRPHRRGAEPYGGAAGGRVLTLRHRDGRPVDVWVRLLPFSGSGAVLALGLDMAALAAWKDESAPGRSLFAQDAWQVAVHGPDLRVRRGNPSLGWTEQTSGDSDPLHAMAWPEGDGTAADLLRAVLETGQVVVGASGILHAGRPGLPDQVYSLTALPVRDLSGRIDGVLSSLVDVTERYQSIRRLDLLYQASHGMSDSLDVRRTAQQLVEVLVPALGDLAAVELAEATLYGDEPPRRVEGLQGDFRRIAAKHEHGPWPAGQIQAGELLPPVADQPGFRRLERGEVLVADNRRQYMAFLGDAPEAGRMVPDDLHASIGAALVARGLVLGYVQVYRTRRSQSFDPQDARLLKEIVARAALGIDNARRYTREHRTAVMLQNSLLPPVTTSTAATETAGIYLPAQGDASVGGDWFDVIPLSSLRTALVVGDVIGHGLRASATMARLRTAVQTLADLDLGPDELLARLDDLVQRMAAESEHPDTVGASCLYAVYDPVSRRCRLAGAGHPAPVVVHPDGGTTVVDLLPGPTLGVGGMPFEVTEVELPPGSVLALYSDSLVELTRGSGAAPGEADVAEHALAARLSRACRPGRSLEDAGHDVIGAVRSARSRPEDDITLLLARTRAVPAESVADWQFPPNPAAVADAREAVRAQLDVWGLELQAFSTELVVSELVTNAIRYATGPVGLRLVRDRVLVCEVTDSSNSQPRLRHARSTDEGGRGLFLVAQVTTRWGSRYGASGKTIWTEQALDDG